MSAEYTDHTGLQCICEHHPKYLFRKHREDEGEIMTLIGSGVVNYCSPNRWTKMSGSASFLHGLFRFAREWGRLARFSLTSVYVTFTNLHTIEEINK